MLTFFLGSVSLHPLDMIFIYLFICLFIYLLQHIIRNAKARSLNGLWSAEVCRGFIHRERRRFKLNYNY